MQVVIIGGGAAGASCAARLSRLKKEASITILEKTDEISIATCGLPYYCSGIIADREDLMISSPAKFKKNFNVTVKLNAEVAEIDRRKKIVKTKDNKEYPYDKLVLSLGAVPALPEIKGIDSPNVFTIRHLRDADNIKDYIIDNKVKKAVVIGGGAVGLEMAESMSVLGLNVSLVEHSSQLLPTMDSDLAVFARNKIADKGVDLFLNEDIENIAPKEIKLASGKKLKADMIIVAIGARPDTKVAAEAGIELGIDGAIRVNPSLQTNDKDIYACGDSTASLDFVSKDEVLIALAGPANRQGRIVADNISGLGQTCQNSQGTAIVKVFDTTLARTGNTEKQLTAKKIPYLKMHIWAGSHAGYYPDARSILIKLLFNKEGRIFGAQAVGAAGVDKRIDVIASIMRMNGTVSDLVNAELCYAPPYSTPKDAVNLIGMAAENVINGNVKPIDITDFKGYLLIDIRPNILFEEGSIKGAVNIPISEFEKKLPTLPKDKKIILFCNNGNGSYNASRIALHNGYDNVYSLSGGLRLYREKIKGK